MHKIISFGKNAHPCTRDGVITFFGEMVCAILATYGNAPGIPKPQGMTDKKLMALGRSLIQSHFRRLVLDYYQFIRTWLPIGKSLTLLKMTATQRQQIFADIQFSFAYARREHMVKHHGTYYSEDPKVFNTHGIRRTLSSRDLRQEMANCFLCLVRNQVFKRLKINIRTVKPADIAQVVSTFKSANADVPVAHQTKKGAESQTDIWRIGPLDIEITKNGAPQTETVTIILTAHQSGEERLSKMYLVMPNRSPYLGNTHNVVDTGTKFMSSNGDTWRYIGHRRGQQDASGTFVEASSTGEWGPVLGSVADLALIDEDGLVYGQNSTEAASVRADWHLQSGSIDAFPFLKRLETDIRHHIQHLYHDDNPSGVEIASRAGKVGCTQIDYGGMTGFFKIFEHSSGPFHVFVFLNPTAANINFHQFFQRIHQVKARVGAAADRSYVSTFARRMKGDGDQPDILYFGFRRLDLAKIEGRQYRAGMPTISVAELIGGTIRVFEPNTLIALLFASQLAGLLKEHPQTFEAYFRGEADQSRRLSELETLLTTDKLHPDDVRALIAAQIRQLQSPITQMDRAIIA